MDRAATAGFYLQRATAFRQGARTAAILYLATGRSVPLLRQAALGMMFAAQFDVLVLLRILVACGRSLRDDIIAAGG